MKVDAKTKFKPWENLDFILVALCALVPYFWFQGGDLLKAEDIRLPYTWEQWKQLFYVWHHGFSTGSELILDNSLIPMMFLPALLQKWGLSLVSTQKVLFIIWYVLPGFTFVYLLRLLYQGPGALAFRIGALSFYLFNLWLENVWIGFKPPLITAYAFVPLILAFMIQILRGQLRLSVGLSLFFLVSFLASGIGNNSSEFGASLAPGLILFGFFFIWGKTWKNPGLFKFLIGRASLLGLVWLAANLYWFLPQCTAIFRNIILQVTGEVVTVNEMITWLHGVSQSTSLQNVIRTLGDWTWYQGCVDPYRSYASLYVPNTPLYFLSWIVPIMVFVGCWNRSIQYRSFFIFLTVSGLLLSMGSHPPVGNLYVWLTKNVPLFWVFRSPYLKFYLWVCLGYSVLFGAACLLFYRLFSKKSYLGISLVALLCLSNLIYAFPITTGRIFHSQDERTFLWPNRIQIPNYVLETGEWLNQQPGFFRYVSLPGDNPFIYKWGGINFGSFSKEFTNKNFAFAYSTQYTLVAQGSINQAKEVLELVRDQIYSESSWYTQDILSLLQVQYLINEKDIRYDFYKGYGFIEGDSPEFIEEKLKKQIGIVPDRAFGPWQIYQTAFHKPLIYGVHPTKTLHLEGPLSLLTWWTYLEKKDQPQALFLNSKKTTSHQVIPTAQLKGTILSDSNGNRDLAKKAKLDLIFLNDVPPEERNGSLWHWWEGTRDKIVLTNTSDATLSVNFSFRVFNIEIPRSFYIQSQDKTFKIMNLKANEEKEIRLENIALPPGETKIKFYTPFQHSWKNSRTINFAFEKESFQFGLLTYKLPLYRDQEEEVLLRIYPANMNPLTKKKKEIWVNGKPTLLKATSNEKKAFYEGKALLPKGKSTLLIEQEGPQNDFIEIKPLSLQENAIAPTPPRVSYEMISPTKYKVKIKTESPFVLVFSESYHPYWKAFTKEKWRKRFFLEHNKVNGFANGYMIDKVGDFTVWLEFTPQRFFKIGLILTLLGLGLSLFYLTRRIFFPSRKE